MYHYQHLKGASPQSSIWKDIRHKSYLDATPFPPVNLCFTEAFCEFNPIVCNLWYIIFYIILIKSHHNAHLQMIMIPSILPKVYEIPDSLG